MTQAVIAHQQDVAVAEALTTRDKVFLVEDEMRKHPPREVPIKHTFGGGMYAREAFLPKDTLATGRIHKQEQINIVSQGDISVLTEQGWIRFKAPSTIVSPLGTKRLVYAHEDTTWVTILRTDLTDPELIFQTCTAESEAEYMASLAASPVKELT